MSIDHFFATERGDAKRHLGEKDGCLSLSCGMRSGGVGSLSLSSTLVPADVSGIELSLRSELNAGVVDGTSGMGEVR